MISSQERMTEQRERRDSIIHFDRAGAGMRDLTGITRNCHVSEWPATPYDYPRRIPKTTLTQVLSN